MATCPGSGTSRTQLTTTRTSQSFLTKKEKKKTRTHPPPMAPVMVMNECEYLYICGCMRECVINVLCARAHRRRGRNAAACSEEKGQQEGIEKEDQGLQKRQLRASSTIRPVQSQLNYLNSYLRNTHNPLAICLYLSVLFSRSRGGVVCVILCCGYLREQETCVLDYLHMPQWLFRCVPLHYTTLLPGCLPRGEPVG
jgi:hypothetical protein